MRKIIILSLLIISVFIVACAPQDEIEREILGDQALAGQAVSYNKDALTNCKNDASCWDQFRSCYTSNYRQLKTSDREGWNACIDECVQSYSSDGAVDVCAEGVDCGFVTEEAMNQKINNAIAQLEETDGAAGILECEDVIVTLAILDDSTLTPAQTCESNGFNDCSSVFISQTYGTDGNISGSIGDTYLPISWGARCSETFLEAVHRGDLLRSLLPTDNLEETTGGIAHVRCCKIN